MTEAEQQEKVEMKKKMEALLQEKAEREDRLRDLIIEKLDSLTKEVHTIRLSTNELPQLRADLRELEKRIKVIEDFKLKAVASMSAAFAILAAIWKLIDHLWK